MEKSFNLNGVEYKIICTSKPNRSGFVHIATFFENEVEVKTCKVQYYNRTWESYRYQTVMKVLMEKISKKIGSEVFNLIYSTL